MSLKKSTVNARTSRHAWTMMSAVALLTALGGCGGGGSMISALPPVASGQSCTPSTCGTTMLSLTDAAGDFLQYKVKLVSLELVKVDHSLVETLPSTTLVDFAQLVDLSEIVSTHQIPEGEYVAANVTIDFSGASILVDDGTGVGVAVKPTDGGGTALGLLKVTVQFDAKNDLNILSGATSRIGLDFNLLASNTVDLAAGTVTVTPVLAASIVPADSKTMRVRGALSAVDTVGSDYTVLLQPFDDGDDDKLSALAVHTTETTAFEINGTPFVGAAGLAQLATLSADTLTVAFGAVDASDQAFTASQVLAGTSVPGIGADHIVGNVIARTANTLTVHGAHMDGHDGGEEFLGGDTIVTIADSTAVTAEGQASAALAHTTAEISVGSRIEAFGSANVTAATAMSPASSTLDATTGRVRLDLTRVQGVVIASGPGQLTMNLSSIDRQSVALFHFAGTGATSAQDSNPASYVLGTGALDLTPFPSGHWALGVGFVALFGSAPPDVIDVTLADNAGTQDGEGQDGDIPGGGGDKLEIEWGDAGTTMPFKVLDSGHLDLNIANTSISGDHQVETNGQEIDLTTLASDPSLVANTTGTDLFVIAHQKSLMVSNFNMFGDFETALAAALNGTPTALKMTASGQYSTAGNIFTARGIVILLND
jgi:hypothetical protein